MLNMCVKYICKTYVLLNTSSTRVKHVFNICETRVKHLLNKTLILHMNNACIKHMCSFNVLNMCALLCKNCV